MTGPDFNWIDFSSPYSKLRDEKEDLLLACLNSLTEWHRRGCPGYNRVLDGIYPGIGDVKHIQDLPYLPVRLFKHFELKSLPDELIVRKLTSSGTSGQQVSKIFIDADTAKLQVRALSSIVQNFIGKQRLPMVIIDQEEVLSSRASFSARAAGVLGFSNFGHHHLYALDESMVPKWDDLARFINQHHGQPILLFGFTSVVWQYLFQVAQARDHTLDFGSGSILIHGGGWKKLKDRQVDNATFKKSLHDRLGIGTVSNYYGMVEQVGSIFMECREGYLHAPDFADVLVRDPITLEPAENGVVQVISLLPRSYPGHSILTEDLGSIIGCDDCKCGRKGKYFLIHGRIPQAELRGCSDVRSV